MNMRSDYRRRMVVKRTWGTPFPCLALTAAGTGCVSQAEHFRQVIASEELLSLLS